MHEEDENSKAAEQAERKANTPPRIHFATLLDHAFCDSSITEPARITADVARVDCRRCTTELQKSEVTRCLKCRTPIDFVRMRTGTPMPVEIPRIVVIPLSLCAAALPKPRTKIITDDGDVVHGYVVDGDEALDARALEGRISHFVTCSHPELFRRRRPVSRRAGRISLDALFRIGAIPTGIACALLSADAYVAGQMILFAVFGALTVALTTIILSPDLDPNTDIPVQERRQR